MKIAILVGSLRAESFNLQLARALARLGPQPWVYQHIAIDRARSVVRLATTTSAGAACSSGPSTPADAPPAPINNTR